MDLFVCNNGVGLLKVCSRLMRRMAPESAARSHPSQLHSCSFRSVSIIYFIFKSLSIPEFE